MQAEIDDLLHTGGIEHRNHRGVENVFRLMRQRGRLAGMVVTGDQQHATVFGGSRGIGMLEHVTRTVHARSLAVPDAEYAVIPGTCK